MRRPTNLSFDELRMFLKLEWYDSIAALVFCPACDMRLAPTHHMGVLGLHASLMYFMNGAALGRLFVILSIYMRAQSKGSSSTLQPFPYIGSPSIWKTMVHSATTFFFTASSAHALWTCHRHKNILELGHTKLKMRENINGGNFNHWGDEKQHGERHT